VAHPEGHWPKIIRAEEHLAVARAEWDFYREGDVYRAVGEFDPTGTEYVLCAELRYPPSPRFAILIGEFFNSLNSALDHLVYSLVRVHAPKRLANPESICFPVWPSDLNKLGKKRPISDLMAGIAGIPEKASAVIEMAQPYHPHNGGTASPLWTVRHLTNLDKHRELLIIGSMAAGGVFGVRRRRDRAPIAQTIVYGTFKPGAEIARLPLSTAQAQEAGAMSHAEMEVYGYAPVVPTLDEPDISTDKSFWDFLENTITYIRTLIGRVAAEGGTF